MSWKMIGDGCFERPLGETEKLLWLIGTSASGVGKEEWHLFVSAKLRFGFEKSFNDERVAALREAWKRLRFDHPSIAAITDGTTITYNVPDAFSLEKWIKKTFIIDRDAKEPEEILTSVGPCDQAQLHVLYHARQLVLHTVHWRSDGRGLPQLLDRLLHHLTDPTPGYMNWGEEIGRLTLSLEDAADMIDQVSQDDLVRVKRMAAQLLKDSPALTIPCLGNAETQAAFPRRCLLTLTAAQTRALVSACKSRNITVTAAVHAAIATTNIAHATPDTKNLEYRSSVRRDLRARVKAPHNSHASAAALFNTAIIVSLPADGSWNGFAHRLTEEYRNNYDDELFRLHRVYYRQLVADIKHAAAKGEGIARAADVDISSIGLVENLVRREYGEGPGLVQVEEVRVSVNSCSRQAAVFVFTFRDCLNMYMTYNEAFHMKENMETFLGDIRETLIAQLGIDG